jgi:putative spermidine/putrescine transport system ATP-binding protein
MALAPHDFRRLRLDSVSRDFGAFTALKNVTLDVARGEFIALLGPSGCGKSTALNCLAGLLTPTSGSIWLDDTRVDRMKPEDRGFGMVFQNYALFPHMTVRRNIGFGLAMRGERRADIARKVDAALALVRLEGQEEKLPGQLSGGQQQRVAIARATVIIHEQVGSTTIYVTHDQDEALSLADRVVVMRDGRVRQIGTPEELYGRPLHADVAEFMGYRNIVAARATSPGNGGLRVAIGDAALIGTPIDAREGDVIVAFRPDDLTPREDGPLAATVTAAEYRGRDFFGKAATAGGTELFFRSDAKVAPGETVRLGVDPARLLIYANGAP